jgi:hypothetical protein
MYYPKSQLCVRVCPNGDGIQVSDLHAKTKMILFARICGSLTA